MNGSAVVHLARLVRRNSGAVDRKAVEARQKQYFTRHEPTPQSAVSPAAYETVRRLATRQVFEDVARRCRKQRESEPFERLEATLDMVDILQVVDLATRVFERLPNVEKIELEDIKLSTVPADREEEHVTPNVSFYVPKTDSLTPTGQHPQLVVVGDTHGTIEALECIFERYGLPGEDGTPIYVFNGDYVDRGAFSTEVFVLLAAMKLAYPRQVYLTRGNHETRYTCQGYSFLAELYGKYGDAQLVEAFKAFVQCFCHLPVAVSICGTMLVIHGGVNPGGAFLTDVLERLNRHREPEGGGMPFLADPLNDLLWADPSPELGYGDEEVQFNEQRQTGSVYGANGTQRFLELHGHEVLIRSHSACQRGFARYHHGRVWTIFSVPNYADGNLGAVLEVTRAAGRLICAPSQFTASQYSAIDNQPFYSQRLITQFNRMTLADIRALRANPGQLRIFFTLFIAGCIEADVGAPRTAKKVVCNGQLPIDLPVILQRAPGLQILVDTICTYMDQQQMDPLGVVGCFERSQQADAVVLAGFDMTLRDCGIDVPDGIFWGCIELDSMQHIIRQSERATVRELRRRELRRQRALQRKQTGVSKAGKPKKSKPQKK